MSKTEFLNVDLDIISEYPLRKLATAFGEDVVVLHCGRWGDRHSAHFEIADSGYRDNPNSLIRQLVRLVKRLSPHARALWDGADSREFNIGIESAQRAPIFELRLRPTTLREVAEVNGTIVVTVYAPEK